jgi:hypothetical protein
VALGNEFGALDGWAACILAMGFLFCLGSGSVRVCLSVEASVNLEIFFLCLYLYQIDF